MRYQEIYMVAELARKIRRQVCRRASRQQSLIRARQSKQSQDTLALMCQSPRMKRNSI